MEDVTNIVIWFIAILWLILVAVWAVSAIGAKKSIRDAQWWRREVRLRVVLFFLILLALRVPVIRQGLRNAQGYAVNTNTLMGMIGVVLCALGIGLAIWARADLGRNWGVPMSRKESPELVTTGPYAFVRHPIYGGIILAMLGSVIAMSILWIAALVLAGIYFTYSARREEQLMTEQFPDQYPAYRKRTKLFLPFIL